MRRFGFALVLALLWIATLPSTATAGGWHHDRHHGHHGHHFHHGHHYGGHFSFGYGPAYYGVWPWWHAPPVTVIEIVEPDEPPVYVEREPDDDGWWYYCESEGAYYPRVETCPEPWVKVEPRPE